MHVHAWEKEISYERGKIKAVNRKMTVVPINGVESVHSLVYKCSIHRLHLTTSPPQKHVTGDTSKRNDKHMSKGFLRLSMGSLLLWFYRPVGMGFLGNHCIQKTGRAK